MTHDHVYTDEMVEFRTDINYYQLQAAVRGRCLGSSFYSRAYELNQCCNRKIMYICPQKNCSHDFCLILLSITSLFYPLDTMHIIIETKGVESIAYNGFVFPHSYSAFSWVLMWYMSIHLSSTVCVLYEAGTANTTRAPVFTSGLLVGSFFWLLCLGVYFVNFVFACLYVCFLLFLFCCCCGLFFIVSVVLCIVCTMLPVSLDCPVGFLSRLFYSCVPRVTNASLDCPFLIATWVSLTCFVFRLEYPWFTLNSKRSIYQSVILLKNILRV